MPRLQRRLWLRVYAARAVNFAAEDWTGMSANDAFANRKNVEVTTFSRDVNQNQETDLTVSQMGRLHDGFACVVVQNGTPHSIVVTFGLNFPLVPPIIIVDDVKIDVVATLETPWNAPLRTAWIIIKFFKNRERAESSRGGTMATAFASDRAKEVNPPRMLLCILGGAAYADERFAKPKPGTVEVDKWHPYKTDVGLFVVLPLTPTSQQVSCAIVQPGRFMKILQLLAAERFMQRHYVRTMASTGVAALLTAEGNHPHFQRESMGGIIALYSRLHGGCSEFAVKLFRTLFTSKDSQRYTTPTGAK